MFRSSDDPNDLLVICRFENLDGAHAFAADPSLPEAMARAGVMSEPQVWFEMEGEAATYPVAVG